MCSVEVCRTAGGVVSLCANRPLFLRVLLLFSACVFRCFFWRWFLEGVKNGPFLVLDYSPFAVVLCLVLYSDLGVFGGC